MRYLFVVIILMGVLPGSSNQTGAFQTPNLSRARAVRANSIISTDHPLIKITVDSQLKYVGELTFSLKNTSLQEVAEVQRFVFARHDKSGRVRRLFIAQFESLLPAIKKGYSFQVKDATRLGDFDYQTDAGLFNFAQAIAARPGAEAERTKAFLAGKGLKVDEDFMAARYARITDPAKHHELILFYLESLADMGLTRAELEPGGSVVAEAEKTFKNFATRALKKFKVFDGQP